MLNSTVLLSQTDTIYRLDFPYRVGYNMYFSQFITYNLNSLGTVEGEESDIEEEQQSFKYQINSDYVDGTDTVVNFHIVAYLEGDSASVESPLYINESGMYFKIPKDLMDEAAELYKIEDKRNIVFHPIKTPIYEGASWASYDYSLLKTIYTCFAIDTLMETAAGVFHAFGIKTASEAADLKGEMRNFKIVSEFESYYAQGVGKIAEFSFIYLINKNTGEKILSGTTEVFLEEIWWSE